VPSKTIYLKEGDVETWDKANALAERSISSLIAEMLRQYVADREQEQKE